jgi:hypothetical protein
MFVNFTEQCCLQLNIYQGYALLGPGSRGPGQLWAKFWVSQANNSTTAYGISRVLMVYRSGFYRLYF